MIRPGHRFFLGSIPDLQRVGYAVLTLVFLWIGPVIAQDPGRFDAEIDSLVARENKTWDPSKKTVLFTGSSSIRMWEALPGTFPEIQIVNTGFGGSQASDLLFHLETLVLNYRPEKVFIYEGDNDLAEGKRPGRVLRTQKQIIQAIQNELPRTEIILISAKPSISRWNLRRRYRRFNRKQQRLARKLPKITFADVWTPMLANGRTLKPELFIEDGLHMNARGYAIWQEVIRPLLSRNSESTKP